MESTIKTKAQKKGKQTSTDSAFIDIPFSTSPIAFRVATISFIVTTLLSLGLLLWIGPCVQMRFGHDTGVYYSCAWKMLWGVKPHVDFYSSLGIINYVFVLAGMK